MTRSGRARAIRLALVGLLAFTVVTVVLDVALNRFHPWVIDTVRERYGIHCSIGDLSWSFPLALVAEDVACFATDTRPWLQATSIRARVNPLAFLSRSRWIDRIDGEDVELTLRRKESGEWDLPRRPRSGGTSDPSSPREALALGAEALTVNVETEHGVGSGRYRSFEGRYASSGNFEAAFAGENGRERFSLNAVDRPKLEFTAWGESVSLAPLSPLLPGAIDLSDVVVSGRGSVARDSTDEVIFHGMGRVEGLGIRHALVSSAAASGVGLGFELHGRKRRDVLTLERGAIFLGGESAVMRGRIEGESRPRISFDVHFPKVDLGAAARAIPRSLLPDLPDLDVRGGIDGTFHFSIDVAKPSTLAWNFDGALDTVTVLGLGPGIDIDAKRDSFVHIVLKPDGETMAIRVGPGAANFTPYAAIPPHMVAAVLTAEDGMFFFHKGFSPRHIRDALVENLAAGRVVRGASTLSMQLAKNLFLSRERTLSRKLEEAFITIALEQKLGKRRMMEIYLNIIEWGDGIYGIGPAARHYFSKSPSELTAVESAFLASIIARPRKGWSTDPLARIGPGWWSYLHVILCKMYRMKHVDLRTLIEAGVPDTAIREVAGDTALAEWVLAPAQDGMLPPGGEKMNFR